MTETIVRIYESELSLIIHETALYETTETGGSLFGLWTNIGNPTILLATRPGARAIRSATQFEQDSGTHRAIEEVLVSCHGVQSVGLWHSHHGLGLHELSGGDVRRTTQFARRNQRRLFCDLLCYFTRPGRGADEQPEVTVKPYVYHDASNGHRLPTSLVVLPGPSPLRGALLKQAFKRDVEEKLRFALAPPPDRWQPRWKAARSIELAQRDDEDGPVSSGGGGLWPFHKKRPEIDGASDIFDSSGPAEPEWDAGNPIPNLESYIHKYLEPALRDIPSRGVACELEPIFDGRALRLTMISADRSAAHEHDLGWDGTHAVVTRSVARIAQDPGPKEMLGRGEVRSMRDVLQDSFSKLGDFHDRR